MTDDQPRQRDESAGPPPGEAEAYAPPPPSPDPAALPAHAVPATPLGETSRCLRCGTENRPGIAFCRECGQRLVAPGAASGATRPTTPLGMTACPRCGTHNRADGSFCANCGASLRGVAPPVAGVSQPATQPGRAVLGPVVLLIAAIGILVAWLLPFAGDAGSLFDRAFGAPGGYGVAFWTDYGSLGHGIAGDAYFGLAAPAPILAGLLAALAAVGIVRGSPGMGQRVALIVSLAWGVGLAIGFVIVEFLGGPAGDLLVTLRAMSPGGIIFLLAGLIVLIGAVTRLARA